MEETTFWQKYVKQVGNKAALKEPKRYQGTILQAKAHLQEAIGNFRKELAKIPLAAEIENWLQGLIIEECKELFKERIQELVRLGVISLTHQGKIRTLNELSPNDHKTIIEEIRCSPELNTARKEESVAAYIDFSQHVSRMTSGLITQGEDPDVMRTLKKIVDYNDFIEFVQLLPERDALIAKLLYFGAPTMDEVLDLRVNQVNTEEKMVKFHKFSMKYPKHVILELGNYLKEKEGNEYVFKNVHGERIERTHLNNCFNRASRKTSKNMRITPKMLLESDIAKSRAKEPVYENLAIQ